MSKIKFNKWSVDIPSFSSRMADNSYEVLFDSVMTFPNRKEAIKYARDTFGADSKGRIYLVARIPD
jgi:hypothetical protein